MSIASEYAARVHEARQIHEAHQQIFEDARQRKNRPAIELKRADSDCYTKRCEVTVEGNLALVSSNEKDTPLTPAEARRLALWILQTFTD